MILSSILLTVVNQNWSKSQQRQIRETINTIYREETMNWKTLEKVSIGFGLTSDQLRKWCKFIKQSLTVEMQTQRP